MRSSNKRSRGKSRNRPSGNIVNRVFDSSGPEGKVRGTPQQIIEKYAQLARDAQLGNDRVAAENFRQHAEHYTRLLAEAQREMDARRDAHEAQQRERQQARGDTRRDEQPARDSIDPSQMPQPDAAVVLEAGSDSDSGLVETPESKPKKRPARTRSKPKKAEAEATSKDGGDQPEAAE